MAIRTITIDLKADGLEQGSFGGVGNVDSPIRVRSINHVALPSDSIDRKFTVSASTSATGKTLQIEFVGFPDSTTNAYNCDLGWYNSPYTFDLSSYTNTKYVRMLFRYSDDSNITPEEITSCNVTYEADVVWHAAEGEYPINDLTPPVLQTDFRKPYPCNYWRIDESNGGYPYNDLMPAVMYVPREESGAFEDASSLASVHVPISVKTIGPTAFAGTALQRVRIAADCTYGEQSFPEGCVVTRYPDDRYEQLYDSAGKAVLDYDARRIYVLKEEPTNG